MSIKNLFSQNRTESREYSDYIDDKTTFEPVESSRNAEQIRIEQNTFVPQVDYSKPSKFVRFGSAEMYYSGAMTHIMDYYPYDGSMAEINKFYNSMMPVEKYIFDNLYPRFNGHAIFSADGWGSGTLTSDGYGVPDTKEYILFKGGPHGVSGPLSSITNNPYNNKYQNSNIYDEDLYTNAGLPSDYDVGTRESNLKTNFDTGVTVEFWLKKDAFVTSTSEKEVVFDLWNSGSSGSAGYGRLTVALTGAASGSPFIITAQSGTVSASISNSSIGNNLTTSSLGTWGHYALRFYNTGSDFIAKLYVNGQLNDTNTYSSQKLGEITSGSMLASLGALVGPPSGSSAARGSGKLSGSMDDFRFWKTSRNSDQISTNYFDRVGGGTNTDISNTTLGVYYKFNEGITQDSSIDSIVLDYSGRISNGVWVGYGSNSRNTGSAIVLAGAATKEYKDPVIRSTHPDYVTLKSNLITSGTNHDVNNAATFINYAPSWILDQHDDTENRNLKIISHIMGAYFDKMYMLASQIPNFKQINYTTASHSPIPFASHLPTSLGMYVPDLFVDATILENLSDRTKTEHFESKLHDTKNLIYLNLYNNLTNIYKSKGTEKSIRNVLRCFNLDDELISVKVYNKNSKYKIRDNLKQVYVEKTAINFDTADNNGAVVYQRKNSSNAQSVGFISGSQDTGANGPEEFNGATVEVDFIFPKYLVRQQTFDRDYVTGSVFGLHAVSTGSSATMDGTDTTLMATDVANFQVLALREKENSKNVYFKLTSSYAPYPLPELTSSVFLNAYDDTRWNVSVRIKPKDYPIAGMVSSSLSNTYDVIFRGVNSVLGVVKNSFEVSGTITNASGSALLRAPKRLYVGAMRTNLTGALLHKSDVEVLNARYWTKFVNTASLDLHAFGKENSGIYDSYQNLAPIDSVGATGDLTNRQTLALNWNFDNVTSSDSGGNFTVQDYSSGSAEARENYGWLGKITGYQHSGYGNNFAASSTSVIEKRKINSYTFVDPEQTVGSDMISILTEDDKVFGVDKINPSYVYSVEKNMYDAISAEMINFFAGAIDFNQLVGAPVNRYRHQYKEIDKLRESFFKRVTTVSDVEKYMDYYKWFDDALSTIIKQLMPASIDSVDTINNVIESHVLERNKYQSKFPTIESKTPEVSGSVYGRSEGSYPYAVGFSPPPQSPRDTTVHEKYWKDRAERTASEISSGIAAVDAQRETFRKIITSIPFLSSSIPQLYESDRTRYADPNSYKRRRLVKNYIYDVKRTNVIKGGINFTDNKNIGFTLTSLRPAGNIDRTGSKIIPQNVLLSFMSDLAQYYRSLDPRPETFKDKRHLKVLSGKEYEDGLGYSNLKSSMAFPFNIISSSNLVDTGYQKEVIQRLTGAQVQITNLHNDVYGPDLEKPMQGPFTEYAVGGHQSRHIGLSDGTETWWTRPEAWRILLGTCTDIASGAIGMVGPDYPNQADYLTPNPYPDVRAQKAVYYRDMVAKRPVNIKNIKLTTGSTILGNYSQTYNYVHSVGAYSNPRHFVDNQPSLPSEVIQNNTTSSTVARTILDVHRTTNGHTENVSEYSTGYLTGAANKSIIISRFGAPGGVEVSARGYQDFRASEYSVYNSLNYRNLSVIKPSQGPSGTISTPATSGDTTNIQVYDIHGKDYGLYSHLARHTAKFGRDSLFVTGTGSSDGGPGASYEQAPGFHKVHRNNLDSFIPVWNASGSVIGYSASVKYDNFNVVHQIPRSSKQYMWITQSLESDNGWIGFTPADYLVKDTEIGQTNGYYVSPYNFLSASEVGSADGPGGNRAFPRDPSISGFVPQSYAINTNIREPVSSSSNILGYPPSVPMSVAGTSATQYVNKPFIILATGINTTTARAFNNLMFKRGNQYGYPSWRQMRHHYHPILRTERKNNQLSLAGLSGSNENITKYNMPPVSMMGRPNTVNFQVSGTNALFTIKATSDNEKIYYNTTEMNNRLAPQFDAFTTPDIQMIHVGRSTGYLLNWVLYEQQIFPALRNEFVSASTNKSGYDNLYWRDERSDRNTVNTVQNRAGTPTLISEYTAENSMGIYVAESCWPLDAQNDFLTRISLLSVNGNRLSGTSGPTLRFNDDFTGELQNVYTTYLTGAYFSELYSDNVADSIDDCLYSLYLGRQAGAGALYARKHTNTSPLSTRAPYGPRAPYAFTSGTLSVEDAVRALSGTTNYDITIGAGEAHWDAPEKAGYAGYDQQSNTFTFVSAASEPWFNTYDDFRQDLKLAAKGFAVIPEYRISENINLYENNGEQFNPYQDLGLEIPHTTENSRTNSKFYITYSNSEFLHDFLNIKAESLLDATEIMISCTGAIRLNPYKGFYPVQRTLDLVTQFKDSHQDNIMASLCTATSSTGTGSPSGSGVTEMPPGTVSGTLLFPEMSGASGLARPFMSKMFSPGLLFNTIKSGMAVDYPIVSKPQVLNRQYHRITGAAGANNSIWAMRANLSIYAGGELGDIKFFDKRLPFETLLEPKKYLNGLSFYDMESHPSASMENVTCAWVAGESDDGYSKLSRNFFGAVPSFFLKDNEFSSIKSEPVTKTFRFQDDEVYMMRVKMERSTTGARVYTNEVDGFLSNVANISGSGTFTTFAKFGGKTFISPSYSTDRSFPLPQDPLYSIGSGSNSPFKETFTMYSRASAFGPDMSGRPTGSVTAGHYPSTGHFAGTIDSINGFNPAFTPPYSNGEAWCDIIFRPSASVDYTLEQIMAECKQVYWRFDAGRPMTGSISGSVGGDGLTYRALIYSNNALSDTSPYDGRILNESSMQLDACLNLFGVEDIEFTEVDRQGLVQNRRPGTTVGKRWVIRPKFETPMMNFSDNALVRPISGSKEGQGPSTKAMTLPANFGEATPNGMWHQFGLPPQSKSQGIFIGVEDVPENWLQNHYDVIEFNSEYNNNAPGQGVHAQVKSLADLVGFNTKNKVRLGELKEKTKLREAIVAIPYITQRPQPQGLDNSTDTEVAKTSKFFISIPEQRYKAALEENYGSRMGDSLEAAGSSISKQLQKMQRYIFPPQLDFINNPEGAVDPFVAYIFEFEYDLDKTDLSYIWQNLAPKDYKKMTIENKSIAHELMDAEILNETVLEENQNLRWMIFKVKQKGQEDYWNYVDTQVRENSSPNTLIGPPERSSYKFEPNWPYDYISFVEMAKLNVNIKYSQPTDEIDRRKLKREKKKVVDNGKARNMYGSTKKSLTFKSIKSTGIGSATSNVTAQIINTGDGGDY